MPSVCRWLFLGSLFAFAAYAAEVPRAAKHDGTPEEKAAQAIGVQAVTHTKRSERKRSTNPLGLCASLAAVLVVVAWFRYRRAQEALKDEDGQKKTHDADHSSAGVKEILREYRYEPGVTTPQYDASGSADDQRDKDRMKATQMRNVPLMGMRMWQKQVQEMEQERKQREERLKKLLEQP